ncbi:hypothetical protein ACP6JA_12220 [Stutzerimonas frequens]
MTEEAVPTIRERLVEAYTEILSPEILAKFEGTDDGLAGIFLPSAPECAMDVMIVGMETKGWNGAFSDIRSEDLSSYISHAMERHANYLAKRPKRSSFEQFHRKVAKRLGCERNQVGWSNILAVDYKKGSPIHCSAFEAIRELSSLLLRKQVEIIQPKTIIFVCGWRYDKYLKHCLGDLISGSNVRTPKALWQFKVGDTLCFRTSHPRYVSGDQYREKALSLAIDHVAKYHPARWPSNP